MDCEFRRICVDNRHPIYFAQNLWYFKNECEYNPFISKWTDEEGYLTLEMSGVIFDEKKIEINKNKLNINNYRLWNIDL
jgi:hypothetical protein